MALSADNQSLLNFVATLKEVKLLYPAIKVTSGLSNISFGMPLRKVVNQHFLSLAIDLLKPVMSGEASQKVGSIVIGTVEGDLHDIGKNIFGSMAEAAGFE